MQKNTQLNIGLFGLGVAGKGLIDVFQESGLPNIGIRKICVKDPLKERAVSRDLLTFQAADILNDPDVNVVVETINGSADAFYIVSEALRRGKNVVTANKKMVAENLSVLLDLQEQTGATLLYESAACAAIPIVRTLDEYFASEALDAVSGIFNGTTNYILTKMFQDNLDFGEALQQAQQMGFAEMDPSSDIDGYDPKYKLILLAAHSHGFIARPEEVLNLGIRHLRYADVLFAQKAGCKIKLLPVCRKIGDAQLALYVLPALVPAHNALYHVDHEYNGVQVHARYSGKQFFHGKGAGGHPTGSALLADLTALQKGFRYLYKKYKNSFPVQLAEDEEIQVYMRAPLNIEPEKLPFSTLLKVEKEVDTYYATGTASIHSLRENRKQLQEQGVFVMQLR